MVLADLGRRLTGALSELSRSSSVDETVLENTLKAIVSALLEADVNVKLVARLRTRIRDAVLPVLTQGKLAEQPHKLRQLVQKTVYDELVLLVDPNPQQKDPKQPLKETWRPHKGQTSVIMFVGLQGSGKTTSCTKLALHYQRRGYKTALVCADTFRAGAFDQLRQNSTRAKIPFYGSYTETDPVAISSMGVAKFRQERFDVVIVDTSGRHRQEQELFEEMKQISVHVKPDLTIMVLDASIGQAAESQSQAFKEAADFGAILVTKMDGHAKGGGAISAVAATKTPIMFIGTGEHFTDLEKFEPSSFVSKLLGMGDMRGLMEHVKDMQRNQDPKRGQEMLKKLEAGIFTIRDLKEQLSQLMSMGPISKIANMIPGMSDMLASAGGGADEAGMKMKRLLFIFDSMTTQELDSDGKIFFESSSPSSSSSLSSSSKSQKQSSSEKGSKLPDGVPRAPNPRILRVARGSGTSVQEVEELLSQHRMFGEMVKKAGGKQGWMAAAKKAQQSGRGRGGMPGAGGMPSAAQMQAMAKMLPPQMQQQLRSPGGMAAMRDMMEKMKLGGGLPGMGGGGGGGGMPDMSQLMNMMGGMGGMGSGAGR